MPGVFFCFVSSLLIAEVAGVEIWKNDQLMIGVDILLTVAGLVYTIGLGFWCYRTWMQVREQQKRKEEAEQACSRLQAEILERDGTLKERQEELTKLNGEYEKLADEVAAQLNDKNKVINTLKTEYEHLCRLVEKREKLPPPAASAVSVPSSTKANKSLSTKTVTVEPGEDKKTAPKQEVPTSNVVDSLKDENKKKKSSRIVESTHSPFESD
ncbi:hypothetical protein M3Y96_00282100 [Aphelenchoides besseyi]|nr:hypothetical protein M3Y96_00282100 [Aphelenchoides besseyi]